MPSTTNSVAIPASKLMHAAVAYNSPEMITMDNIISLATRGKLRTTVPQPKASLRSLPVEVLLEVRVHLVSQLASASHQRADAALIAFEAALPERLCSECALYNTQVIGESVWDWPNYSTGCDCPRPGQSAFDAALAHEGLSPRRRAFKGPGAWTQDFVAGQLGDNKRGIWPLVQNMLAPTGCTLALVPGCPESARVAILEIVPATNNAPVALLRARAEFGLDAISDELSGTYTSFVVTFQLADFTSVSPATASSTEQNVPPLTVPSKTSQFHWHTASSPLPTRSTSLSAVSLAAVFAGRIGDAISLATELGPRTVAAARREPAVFGGFAIALAARVAVAFAT